MCIDLSELISANFWVLLILEFIIGTFVSFYPNYYWGRIVLTYEVVFAGFDYLK